MAKPMWKEKLGNYLIDVSKYFFNGRFCRFADKGHGRHALAHICVKWYDSGGIAGIGFDFD